MISPTIEKPKVRKLKTDSNRKVSFDALCDELTMLARELGPSVKLPTVVDLCSRTGVSVMTLDRALGELEMRKLIVRRNGVGIFTSPNINRRVVSLACDPTFFHSSGASPFWNMLIEQARMRAEAHNDLFELHYMSIVGDTLELPWALSADIASRRVSGVIYIGTFEAGVKSIEASGIPVIVFSGPGSHKVEIDTSSVIKTGAEFLSRHGCQRVALWTPSWTVVSSDEIAQIRTVNCDAFRAGLTAGNAAFLPELVLESKIFVNPGPWVTRSGSQDPGYRAAAATFRQPREMWPDGIVITEDMMTLGALAAMQEAGIRVGEDVKIASHGNRESSVLNGWYDKISVIEIDPGAIVATMLSSLEALMDGKTDVPATALVGATVRVPVAQR